MDEKTLARFEAKIEKAASGCWLWTGACNDKGYGQMRVDRRAQYAHRLAHEHFVGPIPDGMFVCHRCDVPRCVRWDHLFVGTQADNMRDAAAKGRVHSPKGELHGQALFADEYVRTVRRRYATEPISMRALAEAEGVSHSTMMSLLNRGKWQHVEYPPVRTRKPRGARQPLRGDDHWSRKKPNRVARGERAGRTTLTAADVHAIRSARAAGFTLREIAERHGVHLGTVWNIANRKTWRHVPDTEEE